jgi:uncharacterized protein YycO
MAKTTKPTKQQVAQAKARAGGNNPVKVTNAGLKKLGGAALIAASMTPAGRAVKGATVAAKTAGTVAKALAGSPKVVRKAQAVKELKRNKKIVEEIARMQEKTKADKIAKRSVRAMPAKPQGNKEINSNSREIANLRKSGELAKRSAKQVQQSKPAKVVQIKNK